MVELVPKDDEFASAALKAHAIVWYSRCHSKLSAVERTKVEERLASVNVALDSDGSRKSRTFVSSRLPSGAVLNPANGHVYQLVQAPCGIAWTDARKAAEGMRFQGARGHLVTITLAEENDFLKKRFAEAHQTRFGVWLGAYQDKEASDYKESSGGWKWVTGEEWSFSAWGRGEPNDSGGFANHINTLPDGDWNDTKVDEPVTFYIVEFDP